MNETDEWLALADRVYAKGVDVFNGADVGVTAAMQRDPKVVCLTLLGRTLSNFRASVLLIQSGLVVEARTVTRCVWENLFAIAALSKTGQAFVDQLEQDDIASRKRRATGLLNWSASLAQPLDFHDRLQSFRDELTNRHGKVATMVMERSAESGGVKQGYVAYRELSTDAAHPSATALSRHISIPDGEDAPPFTVHAEPNIGEGEADQTLDLLCCAALGVIVAANEIVEGVSVGEPLSDLAAALGELSGRVQSEAA